jgi:hypothetical protein
VASAAYEDASEARGLRFRDVGTVKACNFGPHGNFGPLLARSVAVLGELRIKNEQNRVCKSKVFPQLHFLHFSVGGVFIMTGSS